MAVIQQIRTAQAQSRKLLALLIDPEKQSSVQALYPFLSLPDLIFVGGSTGNQCDICVEELRKHTSRPIVLFPGNITQFTAKADALLFLSVLTSRLPQLLIEPHIQMATTILQSGIETIPMGYLLIDGGRKSSVEIATNTQSVPQTDISTIVQTAVAGQLLGKQLIYLEAGSGAKTPVSSDIIHAVRKQLQVPLIVGGGICTPEAMIRAFDAGADIVVIGNHFEQHPDEIGDFVRIKRNKYGE
ncbi:MAG: geranylgeranylglyceryl/heptaprenylglyceryl phosphate synthase [Paludibacteraceae bacterium]|nr:geranylgeranylglyceryl/heptaprenylglyceryl phosphate synthase [Paludibacteraceae bacterium]